MSYQGINPPVEKLWHHQMRLPGPFQSERININKQGRKMQVARAKLIQRSSLSRTEPTSGKIRTICSDAAEQIESSKQRRRWASERGVNGLGRVW